MAKKKKRPVRYKALPRKKKKVYTVKKRKAVARVKRVVTKIQKPKKSSATISSLKKRIKTKLDETLKDQLFKRDQATTYKQHRAANLKIDKVRRELRKLK